MKSFKVKNYLFLCTTVILLILSAGSCVSPAGKNTEMPEMPLDSSIEKETLENGLTWMFKQNSSPEKRASIRLFVKAGSLMEEDDQEGIAHLVEHMAFNGTEHFSKQELVHYLESIGMEFGPEVNAQTGFHSTIYKLEFPTDDEEIIRNAFQILEDWAHGITFEDEEINKERLVVQEEWRQGLGARRRLLYKWLPFLLKDSLYAQRLPIGKMEDVLNTPEERVRDFYNTWYRPERMGVAVAGDIEPGLVRELIHEHFSFSVSGESPLEPDIKVPVQAGLNVQIVSDPELTESRLSIYTPAPVPSQGTAEDYRRGIVESLYWSIYNSRLEPYQRNEDPPFLWAAGYRFPITRDQHFIALGSSGKSDDILPSIHVLITEEKKVREFGFTPSEIERKKQEMLKHFKQAFDERTNRQSQSIVEEMGRHFLEGESMPGIEWEYRFVQDVLPGITAQELKAYPYSVYESDNLLVSVQVPEGTVIPEENIIEAIKSARTARVSAKEESEIPLELMTDTPEPGEIENATMIQDTGIEVLTLSNGIKVAVKNTDFNENRIYFTAFSPGGSSLVDDDEYIPLATASSIRRFSGLGEMDDLELKQYLDTKDVDISVAIGSFYEGFSGQSSTEDFPTLLEMLYLLFTKPRFDEDGFNTAKERLSAQIENQAKDPNYHYSNRIRELVLGESIRNQALTLESLKKMDLEKSRELYKERFADASDFTFVFAGNTDQVDLKGLLETYLGSLPNLDREESGRDLGIRPAGGIVNEEVEAGIENKGDVAIFFIKEMPWSRKAAATADAAGKILDVMLREKVREDLSGTYSIGVYSILGKIPYEYARVAVYFGCDPDRVDELTQAVFDVLDRTIKEGPDTQLIQNQQEQYRRTYETAVETNEYWLSFISQALKDGRPLDDLLEPSEFNSYVTKESVQEFLKQVVSRDEFIRVVLLPEGFEQE